ncbi:hypothetical protein GQ53DRAFT_750920 [Thozetella sp. PMI_491]|nr:hypothetical protein GQ53DRAFT_750920 [Thozetella sp. PMI_491]
MSNIHTLSPREGVISVLIQYATALDTADIIQLQSSFTHDATQDLTQFSSLGLNFPVIYGRDAIIDVCMKSVGTPLDTSHTLSNFQVVLNGDENEANITCYAEAQHFKKGEGISNGEKDYFLLKSRYNVIVVRQGNDWKISRLVITPLWSQGSSTILGQQTDTNHKTV